MIRTRSRAVATALAAVVVLITGTGWAACEPALAHSHQEVRP